MTRLSARDLARLTREDAPRGANAAILSGSTVKAVQVTEKQFAAQVEDVLKLLGYRYYHTFWSVHSVAGFPDYLALRGCRAVAIELKREGGKATPAQIEWIDAF